MIGHVRSVILYHICLYVIWVLYVNVLTKKKAPYVALYIR